MNVVLDASCAVHLVTRHGVGAEIERAIADASWVGVPDLYVCEVANVFWKRHVLGGDDRDACDAALQAALELPDDVVPTRDLGVEAFALACRLRRPVYELVYVALARRHDATLLTMDRALRDVCRKENVRVL
jgi:predicted nucleic acid-binding protein